MRLAPFALLAVLVLPFVTALPTDAYIGADPQGQWFAYSEPYQPANVVSCMGLMTLQVQRNAVGTWDVLVRQTADVPHPSSVGGPTETIVTSAQSCPFSVAASETHAGLPGSPASGLARVTSSSCHYEEVRVSPFTLGGPAVFTHYRILYSQCYGQTYVYALSVAPEAMI